MGTVEERRQEHSAYQRNNRERNRKALSYLQQILMKLTTITGCLMWG